MFDQKMFEYLIDQKSWKNTIDHKIVLVNLDWEVKEVLFDIVKRTNTPSDIISTLKDKYWGEDTPEINQLIEEIKIMMKPGSSDNNAHTEEETVETIEDIVVHEEIAATIEEEQNNINIQSTINSLISQYPNFNQEDIIALDNLAQYTEGEILNLLNKFQYTVIYLNNDNSIEYLEEVLSILIEDEQTQSDQPDNAAQSFFYTVTDNYIPQPLSGTINANSKEEAYNELVDIYTHELGVSESDLEINIE